MTINRFDYEGQLPGGFALYSGINDIGNQQDDFYDAFTAEHTSGGIHNAPVLSKGSGRISHFVGDPYLVYKSGIVDSIESEGGGGLIDINLTDAATAASGIHVDCTIHDDKLGYSWSYEVVNTSRIRINTADTASPSATEVDFSFSVWTDGDPEESLATDNPLAKRNHIRIASDSPTVIDDLNELIDAGQQYFDAFTTVHTDRGTHDDDVLSRAGGLVTYSGLTFTAGISGPIAQIESASTGETIVTMLDTNRVREALHASVVCDYSSTAYFVPSIKINSLTKFTVYTRDVADDSLVDASFRFNVWYSKG